MMGLNNVSKIIKNFLNQPRVASKNNTSNNRLCASLSFSSYFSRSVGSNSTLLSKKMVRNLHNLNYACKQHTSSTKANNPAAAEPTNVSDNYLTLGKSKRLMRLIYSKFFH